MLDAVPEALRGAGLRYVPLYRGSKASPVSGEPWKAGAPWEEALDVWLRERGDLGLRLEVSSPPLLVLDADVVVRPELTPQGVRDVVDDGRVEAVGWLELGGPTLVLESPGRPDGSHLPGWHAVYSLLPDGGGRSDPAWGRLRNMRLGSALEAKVNGIVRLTPASAVLRALPVAPVTPELMDAVREVAERRRSVFEPSALGPEGDEPGPVPTERYLREGIPHGEQHLELLRVANSLASRGAGVDDIAEVLGRIAERCVQDAGDPWTWAALVRLAEDAVAWIERERAGVRELIARLGMV